jgi:hypothetical protein
MAGCLRARGGGLLDRIEWRDIFDKGQRNNSAKVGLMKFKPIPGEYRYGVAVRDSSNLWLTLWVRRSRKG